MILVAALVVGVVPGTALVEAVEVVAMASTLKLKAVGVDLVVGILMVS